ncbi:hypothetical protein CF326_g6933 [Tilletia indica]|nr:hypothetical protein CF326_g6933 [Tilletia indica]
MDVTIAKGLSVLFQARADSWLQEAALKGWAIDSGFTWFENNPYRNFAGVGVRTVMLNPMLTSAAQDQLVARALLQTDGPSVLRGWRARKYQCRSFQFTRALLRTYYTVFE